MKEIRMGIFGMKRGSSFIEHILANKGNIVAVCDKDSDYFEKARTILGDSTKYFTNFDEFIETPMDAVLLANYFHEHTPYAIRCLEKNIHVLSECTSNSTMAEGVQLVEAAEKSNAFYMLAENYPFMLFNREITRVCKEGTLGKILYGEGEYNHPGNYYSTEKNGLYDSLNHWRRSLPSTYYITHSLAPLCYATGAKPVRVAGMAIYSPAPEDCNAASAVGDRSAIITCINDDNSVFKVTGCAAFGAHNNSYRICGEKGQIENLRGTDSNIMLRYNEWDVPEGMKEVNQYKPDIYDKDNELIEKADHGGGDFIVIRKFFEHIRTNTKPEMDEYFATMLASVAILSHRSVLNNNMPYDVPDFRKAEDRKKFENDNDTPFHYSDGRTPTIPCSSNPDYAPSEIQIANFSKRIKFVD